MNYSQLVALIQDYCETSESSFVTNIPRFVRQAEQRIYRSVAIPAQRKVASLSVATGVALVAQPADLLGVVSFAVIEASGRYHFLIDKDTSFIREAYPLASTTGIPKYYAVVDNTEFLLGPTPNQNLQIELDYHYDPQSIVDAGSSWLGDNAEAVLLHGSLIEAYTYLKGDADVMGQYQKRYDDALMQLAGVEARSKRDDSRDGQIRPGRAQ